MVGARGKASKSKGKGRALVPKPQPLKTINAEAAAGPHGKEHENETSVVVPLSGSKHEDEQVMDEMSAEQDNIGLEIDDDIIVDGNKAGLTNLDEDCNLENTVMLTPEEGTEADKDVNSQEEEKEPDLNARVTNDTKGSSASELLLVENLAENMDTVTEANELLAKVPDSAPVENVVETIKENAIPVNDVKVVAESAPKKKILKKKIIKRKIIPRKTVAVEKTKLQQSDGNEEAEEQSDVNACVTKGIEDLAASEHVHVENLTENMDTDKKVSEQTTEVPVGCPAENVSETIIENASPANEVKAFTEEVIRPKKKIIKRRLIKKKVLVGKSVIAGNEAKLEPSDGIEGSDVPGKADVSLEVNPPFVNNNDPTGDVSKLDDAENSKNEEKVEGKRLVKVKRKLIRIGKKKAQGQTSVNVSPGNAQQKPKLTNDESASKDGQTIEQDIQKEKLVKSKAQVSLLKQRKNDKVVEEGTQNVNGNDTDKPESSKNDELEKIVSMGMIFMCSSDTKKDCYKYNVFGLPAAKKDLVSKIYKGMRLFLFDVNLKMLYGIYKAAEPGGYNCEPKAFRSQFPAQVRFTILDDCLPLAEEKFKKVIKENYFTKNKFDGELTNEQVKNLCKLFRENTKKSKSKLQVQSHGVVASTQVDKKRKRPADGRRVGPGPISSRDRERKRTIPELLRHGPVLRGREEMRRVPVVLDDRYRQPVIVYERESYRPPAVSSSLYHQPLRAEDPPRTRIYSYERDPVVDTYRRDPAIDYRRLEIPALQESTEVRRRDPAIDYRRLEISAPRELTEVRRRDPAIDYRRLEISAPRELTEVRRRDPVDYRNLEISARELTEVRRRDPAIDYRNLEIASRESTEVRRRDPAIHYPERSLRDPYAAYREPPSVYREPASARETDTRRENYDYLSTGVRYPEYYRSDDHRPSLPLHRRY